MSEDKNNKIKNNLCAQKLKLKKKIKFQKSLLKRNLRT